MLHSQIHMRSRPIGIGHLRAFECVARHLNFRAASEELSLTQSAVSRQIQSLETELGVVLFLRHTRAVELTHAGTLLLSTVACALPKIDGAVRQVRQSAGRRSVSITTSSSFAAMWLIPRIDMFQHDHPEIDIRIDASEVAVDMDVADVDLAIRYGPTHAMPEQAIQLFGEQLTPMISPRLLQRSTCIDQPNDLAQFTFIEAGDAHRTHLEWLTWQRWFEVQQLPPISPKRWLYFSHAYQMVQAARAGLGVVLARLPLVSEALTQGDLIEILPQMRIDSPMAYWLLPGPRSSQQPQAAAFCEWLRAQAHAAA